MVDVRVRRGHAERACAVCRLQQLASRVELREHVAQRLAYERMVVDHEHFHATEHSDPRELMQCRTFLPGLESDLPALVLDPCLEPS
jgi:hypothetical protein